MNYYYLARHKYQHYAKQFYCYCIYMVPAIIFFIASVLVRETFLTFYIVVFFWGWMSWTFIEYIIHRFWMHNKPAVTGEKDFANHHYHHTHPTEIKIKPVYRLVLLGVLALLVVLSVNLQNYFTFFVGFYAGFALFFFMHVLLQKKWAANIFRRLHEFHIYHHCKYPNRCFGISTVVWDVIFKTLPPKNARVTDRIRTFYYGDCMS